MDNSYIEIKIFYREALGGWPTRILPNYNFITDGICQERPNPTFK